MSTRVDYPGEVADEQHSGLSLFDGALIVGGGVIAIVVAFALFSFIAGVIAFVVKTVIVVALVTVVAKVVFGRRT